MNIVLFLAASCLFYGAFAYPKQRAGSQKHRVYHPVEETSYFPEETSESVEQQKVEQQYELPLEMSFEDANVYTNGLKDPFPVDLTPSSPHTWTRVAYLDTTDPLQQCPSSLASISTPRASCAKKTDGNGCDSVPIRVSVKSYQTVCGRFRGYQIGTADAFNYRSSRTIEEAYVDGISITYGASGSRHHVFTYAASFVENTNLANCPCAGGSAPQSFVGSDYHCESGNPDESQKYNGTARYYADPLWDGQQCGGNEATCCNKPNLPWFCKTLSEPVSDNLEVRICTDEGLANENVALDYFELFVK